MEVKFKKTSSVAQQPFIVSSGSAGSDPYSCESKIIRPHSHELLEIGLKMRIPKNFYGRIAPRSGLSNNHSIDICGGVIDLDFRGAIQVILTNHSSCPFSVRLGDKITLLIFARLIEISILIAGDDLPATERDSKGFGSSGV